MTEEPQFIGHKIFRLERNSTLVLICYVVETLEEILE